QKVKQAWVIVLMVTVTIFAIINYVQMPASFSSVSPLVVTFFADLILIALRLNTKINKEGIYFQLFPFQLKGSLITWSEIATIEVRKYSPIKEYGGWGFRYGFKNGKAYNVSGNMGLQMVLKNGDKILIGTQKPEELETYLKNN
ncbi:MAG: hypothetical protein JHD28_06905, partial [Bacteroidia bacterium]|nr:hypothetical protein [Bacteroidia bacterium]